MKNKSEWWRNAFLVLIFLGICAMGMDLNKRMDNLIKTIANKQYECTCQPAPSEWVHPGSPETYFYRGNNNEAWEQFPLPEGNLYVPPADNPPEIANF